jgi:hypothetical protein
MGAAGSISTTVGGGGFAGTARTAVGGLEPFGKFAKRTGGGAVPSNGPGTAAGNGDEACPSNRSNASRSARNFNSRFLIASCDVRRSSIAASNRSRARSRCSRNSASRASAAAAAAVTPAAAVVLEAAEATLVGGATTEADAAAGAFTGGAEEAEALLAEAVGDAGSAGEVDGIGSVDGVDDMDGVDGVADEGDAFVAGARVPLAAGLESGAAPSESFPLVGSGRIGLAFACSNSSSARRNSSSRRANSPFGSKIAACNSRVRC